MHYVMCSFNHSKQLLVGTKFEFGAGLNMFPPLGNMRSRDKTVHLQRHHSNEPRSESIKAFEITNEFLRSTSIHGMKYVGQRNRHIFER